MLVTVFVFVGIEGASVYSRHAPNARGCRHRHRAGVSGRAVRCWCWSPCCRTACCCAPSLAALPHTLDGRACCTRSSGRWGAVFISIGLLISVLRQLPVVVAAGGRGAALGGARSGPCRASSRARTRNKVPAAALWLTNIVIQLFLLVTWFAGVRLHAGAEDDQLDDADPLSCWWLPTGSSSWTGKTYEQDGRAAAPATGCAARARHGLAALGMLYAGGPKDSCCSRRSCTRRAPSCTSWPAASRRAALHRHPRRSSSACSCSLALPAGHQPSGRWCPASITV